jgi:N-acetylneuraminate synthase
MGAIIIAEIGINHNGDLAIAKKLIDAAHWAGADAVKFQKRTIDRVYTPEFLAGYRESPWGTTQRDQKEGLEFGRAEYDEIDRYCREKEMQWYASAWDLEALKFLSRYEQRYAKVASAMLSHTAFLRSVANMRRYTFISTGMHTMDEIAAAVEVFRQADCPFELMHCVSTYPMSVEDANLHVIETLRRRFDCKVGYSGHEVGLAVSLAAAALGATSIERHITLDRAMYGSDQAASVEVDGFHRLVKMVRTVEAALGDGKKSITKDEMAIRKKLVGTPHN